MRLYLYGHEYKYAVEQMLLTLFPNERPEYPEGRPAGDRMEIRLSRAGRRTTASCVYHRGTERFQGRAAADNASLGGKLTTDRKCQRLVKNAIYRAALSSGVPEPVWGALTGVRPGKLLAGLLEQGLDEREALRQFRSEYRVSPERAALCLDASRHTLAARHSLAVRDICLYVGIPFCPTRCAYCSFVSQSVEKSMKLIPPFLDALEREIAAVAAQVRALGLRVVSIYMGGGTPTTLNAKELERLCAKLEAEFDLSALREYTVEAGRPDTITRERLQVLRAHGVDRVSVNPQTMSDAVLEAIGRKHTAAAVEQALVLALAPENITVHTLSLKKGSRITLEETPLPDAQDVGNMLDLAGERLRKSGYAPYYLYRQKFMSGGFENVGWAKPGTENLYNICIMEELCSILAMGGGGSSKLIRPDEGRNLRLMAPKYPLEYIQKIEKTCADKVQIAAFYHEFLKED